MLQDTILDILEKAKQRLLVQLIDIHISKSVHQTVQIRIDLKYFVRHFKSEIKLCVLINVMLYSTECDSVTCV